MYTYSKLLGGAEGSMLPKHLQGATCKRTFTQISVGGGIYTFDPVQITETRAHNTCFVKSLNLYVEHLQQEHVKDI